MVMTRASNETCSASARVEMRWFAMRAPSVQKKMNPEKKKLADADGREVNNGGAQLGQ